MLAIITGATGEAVIVRIEGIIQGIWMNVLKTIDFMDISSWSEMLFKIAGVFLFSLFYFIKRGKSF